VNDPAKVVRNTTPAPRATPGVNPTTGPTRRDRDFPEPTRGPVALASNVSITGRVFYRGPRPPRKPIDLSACPQCAAAAGGPIYDESLVVNDDGSLQNVVVSISGGITPGEQFASATEPVTLDQKGCTFRPHVIAARVGQAIIVKNSDPFLHTVHSLDAEESPAFNFAQPTIGQRQVEPLRAVETFEVTCDLHPWMKGWVRVFNHPYFTITRADGSFALPPLPPGTYRVKAWHERLGVREKSVEIRPDRRAVVDLTFDAR
jgi:plastocyanin